MQVDKVCHSAWTIYLHYLVYKWTYWGIIEFDYVGYLHYPKYLDNLIPYYTCHNI